MGFLHKLWDETLAGPTPDTGLSKLRKFDSSPPSVTPIITGIRPNSDFRGFPSYSDILTCARTPAGDFEKFAGGKSSVQSSVRAVTTTPTEFYWVMGNSELHEILRMEEEEEEEEEESRTC